MAPASRSCSSRLSTSARVTGVCRMPGLTLSVVRERWIPTRHSPVIGSRAALAAALAACIPEDDAREHFVVALLDRHRRLLGLHTASIGFLTGVLIDPGGILRLALLVGARFIGVAHNHCSGDPQPSKYDADVTRKLIGGAELLGMELVDHVVFGRGGRWVSVCETCGLGASDWRMPGRRRKGVETRGRAGP